MALVRSRWVLAVLATLLLAEGGARLLDGHIAATDQRGHPELEHKWEQVGALAEGGAAPEVVAFGNSMMDGAFVPAAFAAAGGGSAYNAAFLNAPLVTIEDWGRMVVDRLDPEVAIVMVHPLDTIEGGDVSFGQTGGTLAPSFAEALDQLDPGPLDRLAERAESASALVRHRTTLRQPRQLWDAITDTVEGNPRPAPQRIDEAAPLHEIDWDAALDDQGWNTRFSEPLLRDDFALDLSFVGRLADTGTFDPQPVRDVLRALDGAPRRVLVIPPVATEVLDRNGVAAAPLAARARRLVEVAQDEGVEVVDMSGAAYPTALFHDPVHLAREGAERFSRELAAALAR